MHPTDLLTLSQKLAHDKTLQGVNGCGPRFGKEKIVENLAADDKALHRQHPTRQGVVQFIATQVDRRSARVWAAENNAGNSRPRQVAHLPKQPQLVEDGHRLAGEGVAADLVAGEALLVQQQSRQPVALRIQRGRGTGWTAADDDEVVSLHVARK